MRPTDYGPVPVSRLKAERRKIYEALRAGRRVLVSRRGEVEAIYDPDLPELVALSIATPAVPALLRCITATDLGQRNPSAYVNDALEGRLSVLTKTNQLYGVLRPVSQWEVAAENRTEAEIKAERAAVEKVQRRAAKLDLSRDETRSLVAQVRQQFAYRTRPDPAIVARATDLARRYGHDAGDDEVLSGLTAYLVDLHAQAGPRHPATLVVENNLLAVLANKYGASPRLADSAASVSAELASWHVANAESARVNAGNLTKETISHQWAGAECVLVDDEDRSLVESMAVLTYGD